MTDGFTLKSGKGGGVCINGKLFDLLTGVTACDNELNKQEFKTYINGCCRLGPCLSISLPLCMITFHFYMIYQMKTTHYKLNASEALFEYTFIKNVRSQKLTT